MRKRLLSFGCMAIGLCVAAGVQAQYPDKPIRVVVPFSPGNNVDVIVRIFKKAIEDNKLLPQPLVIVNMDGASGTVGSRRVKDSEPDGYTFLALHQTILTTAALGRVEYGPEAFESVAGTASECTVTTVAQNSPYKSLADLLAAAKATPNTLIHAANIGAVSHMIGVMLQGAQPGASFRFVQTGGGPENFAALKGGHVATSVFTASEYLRYKDGGIRALAFLGPERHPLLKDLPTAKEQGFDVSFCIQIWWWAPKGTPRDRIDVFAGALEKAAKTPYVIEQLEKIANVSTFAKGPALTKLIAEYDANIRKVVPLMKQ
jgi:tripartite-type tricarboxylate transporter receptor subunit TctC